MIKTLFFISALLLLPGLGYAGNPSAPFSDQVVPADPPTVVPAPPPTVDVGGVGSSGACDYGPNYTGTLPTAVQNAGFTTCSLNADFTSGFFSSDVSTWVNGCGASAQQWGRFVWEAPWGSPGSAPCRVAMETDSSIGKSVLHLQQTPADLATHSFWSWDYPGWQQSVSGGPTYPVYMYIETTLKFSAASLTEGGGQAGPIDIYINGYNSPGVGGGFEHDFIEYGGGNPNYGSFAHFWIGGTGYGVNAISFTADLSQYHKLGFLVTGDGSNKTAQCVWVDDVGKGCFSMQASGYCSGYSNPAACQSWSFIEHGGIISIFMGQGQVNQGPNNVDMYMQTERVFTCAGYKNASTFCTGPVITTQ